MTTRQLLIRIARRRVRPGTGSSEAFLRGRTAMIPWPDLRPVLKGIEWVVVGGVATRAYMPERMTRELDILIRAADEETALAQLQGAGYRITGQLAIAGHQLRSPEGQEVDLILSDAAWLDEALQMPEHDPAGYPVLPLPYLVLLKLDSSRTQHVADIARMLGWASDEMLNAVRAVVDSYRPEDQEDLESLIYIGQHERQEPDAGESDG